MTYKLTSKGHFQNLTSGQDHDLNKIFACQSIRLDKTNTLHLRSSLYLAPLKSYCPRTVGDLWWRHVTYNAHWSGHWCISRHLCSANTYMNMFRLLRIVFTRNRVNWNLSHWLIMGKLQNWPDLRSQVYKFQDISFVDSITLINRWKFWSDRPTGVASVRVWLFFRLGHNLTWWPDLWQPGAKKFTPYATKVHKELC